MRYQGSEAYWMETAEPRRELAPEPGRASLEVVEGGGLDARVRRGVSARFLARFRVALLAVAVLFVLGAARVALTSGTVRLLQENSSLKTQISEVEASSSDLKIARSVLSSNSRIARIATQNLGMVLATGHDTVDASPYLDPSPAAGTAQADGDAAQASPAGSE